MIKKMNKISRNKRQNNKTRDSLIVYRDIDIESCDENTNKQKTDISKLITNDFFGLLKDKPIEIKKMKVLEIYRYIFRFCIEKLRNYVDNPFLMMITLQYVKST